MYVFSNKIIEKDGKKIKTTIVSLAKETKKKSKG